MINDLKLHVEEAGIPMPSSLFEDNIQVVVTPGQTQAEISAKNIKDRRFVVTQKNVKLS